MTTLTVTILEEATVCEGPDTVYRYDLVAPVLTQPWALKAVVEQAQALLDGQWRGAEVRVESEGYEQEAAAVEEALRDAGVGQKEEISENLDTGEADDSTEILADIRSAAHRRRAPTKDLWRRFTWWHAAMAGVIVVVLALSWWAVGERYPTTQPAPVVQSGAAVRSESAAQSEVVEGSEAVENPEGQGAVEREKAPASPTVVHEIAGLRVSTAAGFRAEMQGDTVVLLGEDEDLRIRISADPLFSVPPEEVLKEVRATVERDPTLSAESDEEGKVRYREEPGDGSQVQWSAWIAAEHHMSVGCQTRTAPTLVQRAACRMAEESLGLL
ncbi:type VII secretion-associated protein [Corynebacterium lowii]|uniref:Type VII secretion-associated protein n=1 Tax=Corynebacterium lowii TaxID=1544413 RepID=A0A0Q0YKH9_9CORY|nr:type VII secretion-associated protein [Corynebacterium lowii]KQB87422.1 hypothetical protein Clow_00481 [Corynebacterium lowii]MDP9851988.1 type VII secretion-associated protein (TIGR03931 family) [Corynebacterium lowii]